VTESQPPIDLPYASVTEFGNAALLVRLAAIFLYVAAGLDFLYGLIQIAMAFVMPYLMRASTPPGEAPPPPHMDMIIVIMYAAIGVLCLLVCGLKLIAATKLLRVRRHAWGFGLAAGIVSCTQFWCSLFCVLPMGAGIYTIVILCLENVRRYLAVPPTVEAAPSAI